MLYRIIQEPGFDAGQHVKVGAPLALVALGVIALACAASMRAEEKGAEFRELKPAA